MSRSWAIPTWYFFHTFAEKIHPGFYKHNAGLCFGIIKNICQNLPCPDCKYHATRYMNGIRLQDVSTKEDLKFVLFTFHNDVNRRLGKPIYSWDDLEIYKRARKMPIFLYFLQSFGTKYMSQRDFSGWKRNASLNMVETFMKKWWKYFA
jgi:hypothetical protein